MQQRLHSTEIIRRYYKTHEAKSKGFSTDEEVLEVELIIEQLLVSIMTDLR
jgi:uncharacterized protein (UPF0371 family)